MSRPSRFFAARVAGLSVFDPLGDQVGHVRDLVLGFAGSRYARLVGLVVEVSGRRRVFVPMTRVTSVDAGQVITTGLVNLRRFEQRPGETLVMAELLERRVRVRLGDEVVDATVEDIGLERRSLRDWSATKAFVRKGAPTPERRGLAGFRRRRGETVLVDIADVSGLMVVDARQGATRLLESFRELKAADVAEILHGLVPHRRAQIAAQLDDDRLADVLEELPEDDQVEILATLESTRAADVLEAMQPDDAADLLSELSPEAQERYLELMEPEDAEDIRRLLTYDDDSAGGLMTSEPVILPPEATVAEALAHVRRAEISPAIAATVFVCRGPHETPTGTFLGVAHIQRLLREPPHMAVGGVLDKNVTGLGPDSSIGAVARELATYNMVSVPIVDDEHHLLGAVTIDDVLDHLLPDDWRESRDEVTDA